MSYAGWGMFCTMLKYKAEIGNITLLARLLERQTPGLQLQFKTQLVEDWIDRIPNDYLCIKHGQRLSSFSRQR